MADGDTVAVLLTTLPRYQAVRDARADHWGWPRILREAATSPPMRRSSKARSRATPRCGIRAPAIGSLATARRCTCTVDGRSEDSGGMTLDEIARMMRDSAHGRP